MFPNLKNDNMCIAHCAVKGHCSLGAERYVQNIAKGTTDPGVDCFNQQLWFGLMGLVWLGWFGLVGLVWQVWFGRFGLVGLVWQVWFAKFAYFAYSTNSASSACLHILHILYILYILYILHILHILHILRILHILHQGSVRLEPKGQFEVRRAASHVFNVKLNFKVGFF